MLSASRYRPKEYDLEDGPWDPISGGASVLLGTLASLVVGAAVIPTDIVRALKLTPAHLRRPHDARELDSMDERCDLVSEGFSKDRGSDRASPRRTLPCPSTSRQWIHRRRTVRPRLPVRLRKKRRAILFSTKYFGHITRLVIQLEIHPQHQKIVPVMQRYPHAVYRPAQIPRVSKKIPKTSVQRTPNANMPVNTPSKKSADDRIVLAVSLSRV